MHIAFVGFGPSCLAAYLEMARQFQDKIRAVTIFDRQGIFNGKGAISSVSGLDRLMELPSFHSIHRTLPVGSRVQRTVDTVGRGGVVYWIADSFDTILTDLAVFRGLDNDGLLYKVDYETVKVEEDA